jgi:general transcription factor 3C polypeptide 5 (transcription factor C subunit 1)
MMDAFGATTENNQRPLPARNQPIPYDEPNVPAGPVGDIPPLASLEPAMQRLIESARLLLDERPIWTRRALHNRVSAEDLDSVGLNSAKYIYQYVGYLFDSGPWRDAIVKFGVDPRQDPSLRIYQTMMFMLDKECHDQNRIKERKSPRFRPSKLARKDTHIFDGKEVNLDGKVWQVCDIKDPLLESLLSTTDIREDCHVCSF